MNEALLEAERALSLGLVDRAERLYREIAEAEPASGDAVVGLAWVALERGDVRGALRHAWRALAIDRDDDTARRLAARLEEVLTTRGEALPSREVDA